MRDDPDNEVRQERTGFRDEAISERHRHWGIDCPGLDIDFLLIEYDLSEAIGLAEYKHWKSNLLQFDHPTYRVLINLANRALIPCWVARYWPDFWGFQSFPLNADANQYFKFGEPLEERIYVMKLFQIREKARELRNYPYRTLWQNFRSREPELYHQKPIV